MVPARAAYPGRAPRAAPETDPAAVGSDRLTRWLSGQAGLELEVLLPHPPGVLGLQPCATMCSSFLPSFDHVLVTPYEWRNCQLRILLFDSTIVLQAITFVTFAGRGVVCIGNLPLLSTECESTVTSK